MSESVNVTQNNKRMLKNTFALYVRMLITMVIGFYATRKLLSAIGVIDFGLVNVVGSVVLMFSFLSGTMQATAARYLSTEIGHKNPDRLRETFNLTLLLYLGLVVLIVILSETIGLWCFEHKLVVPDDRRVAAYWFFQWSVAAFVVNILTVPYSALLISHEKIKVYAWVSTAEALCRLLIVFMLDFGGYDRLALYGALLTIISIIVFIAYFSYCHRQHPECRFRLYWDAARSRDMLGFAGWNLWGALSGLFSNVFLNVLLNSYFGPIVNAARGVAVQGATGVSSFVTNFLTAVRPQIFKYHAEGNGWHAVELTMRSSRGGYYLLFLFALPALLEMPFVLNIWLVEVPMNASLFMRLILVQRLIDIMAFPLVTLSQATGRVALYQTVVGILQWAVFPLAWIALKLGCGPAVVFWVGIVLSIIALIAQFYLVARVALSFSIPKFLREVVLPCGVVSLLSLPLPLVIHSTMPNGWLRFVVVSGVCFVVVVLTTYFWGIRVDERRVVANFLVKQLQRKNL